MSIGQFLRVYKEKIGVFVLVISLIVVIFFVSRSTTDGKVKISEPEGWSGKLYECPLVGQRKRPECQENINCTWNNTDDVCMHRDTRNPTHDGYCPVEDSNCRGSRYRDFCVWRDGKCQFKDF
jgi:hypothetical protein